jgi:hypothetical protein
MYASDLLVAGQDAAPASQVRRSLVQASTAHLAQRGPSPARRPDAYLARENEAAIAPPAVRSSRVAPCIE